MSNPFTFLRPLRHDAVQRVLLVQSGPIDLARAAAARLRTVFPGCTLTGVIREADRDAVGAAELDEIVEARWEERWEIVRRLRQQPFDVVVTLASARDGQSLRLLPYLLRTRGILVFNDHLDYFPLHLGRLPALAQHLSGRGSVGGLAVWLAGRAVLVPLATLVLLGSAARRYARAAWRRRRTRA